MRLGVMFCEMMCLWDATADGTIKAPRITPGVLSVGELARDMWSQYMWWGVASDKIPTLNVCSSRVPRYWLWFSREKTLCCLSTV